MSEDIPLYGPPGPCECESEVCTHVPLRCPRPAVCNAALFNPEQPGSPIYRPMCGICPTAIYEKPLTETPQ